MRPAHLQALFARRREIEHNRIERTEAANKYFDHWGKVTARFENWTAPEYYQQAEKQLQKTREQKEKQKRLQERQQKLSELLAMEKKMHEQELREKEKHPRRSIDTEMLEKIDKNVKEQQQMRRKLELEAKLYGKLRHGVNDGNLVFESKSDNEVLAKLNWLDKQVEQQMHKEHEQEKAKEREIKLHQELNKAEEIQKERQRIQEKEIREIRGLQEYHMEQLKECQKKTDALNEKEKQLKNNLEVIEKEIELLQESSEALEKRVEFGQAYNFNKIKIFIRQRSEFFRGQIKLCLSIIERALDSAQKPETLKSLKQRLETDLENEGLKMTQFEAMYESEAKFNLKRYEELWQAEHKERCQYIKQALMEERHLIKTTLNDVMKNHEEFLELRSTHLKVIENSNEKLKHLIHEEGNSQSYRKHVDFSGDKYVTSQLEGAENTAFHSPQRQAARDMQRSVESAHRHNCDDSNDSNLSPRCFNANDCNDIDQASNSFNNWGEKQGKYGPSSKEELQMKKTNAQRAMQVVTAETEAERTTVHSHQRQAASDIQRSVESAHRHNCDDSNDSNLSPRCFDANDCNDIEQASNSFNNLNLGEWQGEYGHASKEELEMKKTNAQRAMQVVTAETEAERPRFGRKHIAWD